MRKIIFFLSITLITMSLNAQIPTNGLISYYPFNGNANDESLNDNNGVVMGASLTFDRFGNENNAYHFDGLNDWINLGDDPSLHYRQSTSSTISIWFNSNSKNSPYQDLVRYDDLDSGDGDGINPRNLLMLRLENADSDADLDLRYMFGKADPLSFTNNMFFASNKVAINSWNHLCAIKDNEKDSSYLYLNGQLIYAQEDNAVGLWETTGQYIMLGKYNSNNWNGFSGKMDDVRFYDFPLNQCQILALYHEHEVSYNTISVSGLILSSNSTDVNYQWINCNLDNAIIPGETSQTYTANSIGSFAVIIYEYGCPDTSACVNISYLGIADNLEASNIEISPNPTSNHLSIIGIDLNVSEIMITDIDGNLVEFRIQGTGLIDVSELGSGIYFISIKIKDKTLTKKFIKI